MQAIVTKYIGATDTKPSRVKATAEAGSVTINWNDEFNVEGNHRAAADALSAKLGWNTGSYPTLTGPHGLPGNESGFVFTFGPRRASGVFTLEAGRLIRKNGAAFITIHRAEDAAGLAYISPVECDDMARHIVDLLNAVSE